MTRPFLMAKAVLAAVFVLLTGQSSGLKTVQVANNETVTIGLSKESMTRIGLKEDRIAALYGEENNYEMEQEAQLGQLMLKPVVSEPFRVTMITEKGNSIDLIFKPQKKDPETVLIEVIKSSLASAVDEEEKKQAALNRDEVLTKIMISLVKGERSLGFYESQEMGSIPSKLTLLQKTSYRSKDRIAQVLTLQNTGKTALYLQEKLFANPKVEALAISQARLGVGEVARVYVVRAV